MGWRVTTPPDTLPIGIEMMRAHCNVTSEKQNDLLMSYVATATAHAEERLAMSIVSRTITADYESGTELVLPRGPVIQVQIVRDSAEADVEYERYRVGNEDRVRVSPAQRYPLTIVYRAGFESIADIPADIIGAIRVHAATLYAWREDLSAASVSTVHKLDDFYRRRSRGAPVA